MLDSKGIGRVYEVREHGARCELALALLEPLDRDEAHVPALDLVLQRRRSERPHPGRTKGMAVIRTIYEDPRARGHGRAQLLPRGRGGAAGEEATIFRLSEALYQSLFHLGILSRFATRLPNNGWLDMAEEGILFHEGLPGAVQLLHHHAACAAGNTYDWLCSRQFPAGIEYRIRVDGREFQRELLALAAFLEEGVQRGCDVQLWL